LLAGALSTACSKPEPETDAAGYSAAAYPADNVVFAGSPAAAYGDERITYKQADATNVESNSAVSVTAAAQPGTPAGPYAGSGATPTSAAAPGGATFSDSNGAVLSSPPSPTPAPAAAASGVTMPAAAPSASMAPPVVTTDVPVVPTTAGPSAGAAGAPSVPPEADAGTVHGDAGAPKGDAGVEAPDAGALAPLTFLAQELPAAPEPAATPQSAAPARPLQPENPFRITENMPASTFSIDVDTGSYTLARAALNQGVLPSPSAVRVEEFVNYFHMNYAQPEGDVPFSVYSELGACPWQPDHRLMMVGIQGQEVPLVDQPPANLVFLLDISGSMAEPNKLPLLQKGFRMLARQLRPVDKVSIVTYAGADRVVLEGVPGDETDRILAAINGLQSAGSTNGEGGIQRAYEIAGEQFIEGGNNRVLLATDGDFNVGISDVPELTELIAKKRDTGVFLSVYGFGSPTGNFQDPTAEQLADNGNGIYFFVDSPEEARRAFIHSVTGSLLTVAKDVKLQLEFNPDDVIAYRLVGFENRVLSNADFSNDAVDAGELGAGLSVTAFFELIPPGPGASIPTAAPGTDPLEMVDSALDPQAPLAEDPEFPPVRGDDLVEVRIRYKGRDATKSDLIVGRYREADLTRGKTSLKFNFASAVAELAMQLRGSQYLPTIRTDALDSQIESAKPADIQGAVDEFLGLARTAQSL
jgi:Ca-activated chloride channel family protein